MSTRELTRTPALGATAVQRQRSTKACDHWEKTWELVKQLSDSSMSSTDDFDRVHENLLMPVGEWCQDFKTVLGNAVIEDPKYHERRFRFVDEFLVTFPGETDLVTLNMMRAKGEALMGMGRQNEAEAAFAATVERFPDDARAYIGWADQYMFPAPVGFWKDHSRAEELPQRALSRTALLHRDAVLDRLEELYLDWGKPEKAEAIASERQARFVRELDRKVTQRELLPGPDQAPVVGVKVSRNESCPCESGKKYQEVLPGPRRSGMGLTTGGADAIDMHRIDEIYFQDLETGRIYVSYGQDGALGNVGSVKNGYIGDDMGHQVKILHMDDEANTFIEGATDVPIGIWTTLSMAWGEQFDKTIVVALGGLVVATIGTVTYKQGAAAGSAAAAKTTSQATAAATKLSFTGTLHTMFKVSRLWARGGRRMQRPVGYRSARMANLASRSRPSVSPAGTVCFARKLSEASDSLHIGGE